MIPKPLYITWLNYLGGFEYFMFKAFKEYTVDVISSGVVRQNIFPQWPKSYGSNADTIDKQTYRTTKRSITVRSQLLSLNQLDAITVLKTSPLVQIVTSRNDRKTVLVDTDSFKIYSEDQKVFTVTFRVTMTDENPSQRA